MDISSLSMALSQSRIMSDVSVSMLSKSLDMAETVSEGITDMIDSAATSVPAIDGIGGNIDITL